MIGSTEENFIIKVELNTTDISSTNCYANQKLYHRGISSYFIDPKSRNYVYINPKNDLCVGKVNKHLMPQSYFK